MDSMGFGFDYGTGSSIGGAVSFGDDSADFGGGMPGVELGFGGGFSIGFDFCWIRNVICKGC